MCNIFIKSQFCEVLIGIQNLKTKLILESAWPPIENLTQRTELTLSLSVGTEAPLA